MLITEIEDEDVTATTFQKNLVFLCGIFMDIASLFQVVE